jgi:hypothetical protein
MTLHIYPLEDWIEHRTEQKAHECDCPCCPTVEWNDPVTGVSHPQPLVIHNMLGDGFEMSVVVCSLYIPPVKTVNVFTIPPMVVLTVIFPFLLLAGLCLYEIIKRF